MFLQPVISCKQSGFRKQDSTEFQLTRLVQHWSTAMDSSQVFSVLFLDIKKAFDCVYLPGLIYKLQSAGVHGNALNWFRNFLLDRRQRTIIGQSVSALEYLHAGVPQEAILSPLLFYLYMNNITASTCGDVNLFADDTSAFTVSDSAQNLQLSLQTVANDLSSWFKSWALTINVEKTAVMVLCTRQKVPTISIIINGSEIKQVRVQKHQRWTADLDGSCFYNCQQDFLKTRLAMPVATTCTTSGYPNSLPHLCSSCSGVRIPCLEWSCNIRDRRKVDLFHAIEKCHSMRFVITYIHLLCDWNTLRCKPLFTICLHTYFQ